MQNLVRYHNDFNDISLRSLTEKELDLLMSVCFKLKNQDINEVRLDFKELRNLSNYASRDIKRFREDIRKASKKIISLQFDFENEEVEGATNIFEAFFLSKKEDILVIKVKDKYKYLLNELTKNYTKFELEQFIKLKSSYNKLLFKLLKQFDNNKNEDNNWRTFTIEEFRKVLDIPEKYRMSEINSRVLNKINKTELSTCFKNLEIEYSKVGRSIEKIKFIWESSYVKPSEKIINVKNKTVKEKKKAQIENAEIVENNEIKSEVEILKEKVAARLIKIKNTKLLGEISNLNKLEEVEYFIKNYNLKID